MEVFTFSNYLFYMLSGMINKRVLLPSNTVMEKLL